VAIQAWVDNNDGKFPIDWKNLWDDGHYCVAVGYDEERIFFMDPSTLGHYTYIPISGTSSLSLTFIFIFISILSLSLSLFLSYCSLMIDL
jgi:hypothetical protein